MEKGAGAIGDESPLARAERLGHRLDSIEVSRPGLDSRATARPGLDSRATAREGGGDALPQSLRAKMERAFRRDLSRVRLRLTDEPRQIGARALTRGEEIAMAPYHFRPESLEGQALVGHELAHVLQQREGRAGRPAANGILDSPPLEAEAASQGAQAARGGPVALAPSPGGASTGASTASLAASPSQAAPAQPGWEWIDLGGGRPPVRKNVKDNGNGTWTLKGGGTFQDSGAKHGTGARILGSNAPPPVVQAPPVVQNPNAQVFDPKNVLFGIQESGKFEYLGNTGPNRQAHAGKYYEMAPKDFARFKGSGKRTPSEKVMDPVSLKKYAYDEGGSQLYEWDKAKPNKRGTAIDTTKGLNNAPSANEELIDRLGKGELVDRRRKDRTTEDLIPWDVGPYKNNLTLPSSSNPKLTQTYAPLSKFDAWKNGNLVNRDHVPSGESLNQRGDSGAYGQGVTIAIPNPELHLPFSPTFGTDNSLGKGMMDEDMSGNQVRRVQFDKDNPGGAAYRDTKFMLDSTDNQDYSASGHKYLDLTRPKNRLRQIGGYRKLNRMNVKLHSKFGAQRGWDPTAVPAVDFKAHNRVLKKGKKITKRKVGAMTYSSIPKTTQGKLMFDMLQKELAKTNLAKLI